MRKIKISLLTGGIVALVIAGQALGAGFFTNGVPVAGGSQYPTTVPLTGNETIPADTNLSSGLNPASEAITTAQLAAFASPAATPRNYLVNGSMAVAQQGTAAIVGGTTTVTALQFAADRWFIDTNVTSGAGKGQVVAGSSATGFANYMKIWRDSGALTQPVCMIQAIETARATQLAGKNVVLSANLKALAGLTASGGIVSAYVITGTGTDEGLATLTASPAITPAWTGIATAGSAAFALPVSTPAWARYYTGAIAIPSTATEVGVELCFTPVGSSSGATDGFAAVGIQLEAVGSATGAPVAPSTYEFRPYGAELLEAQRFFYQLSEPASGAAVPLVCQNVASGSQSCMLPLPALMRGTTPVVVIPTAGTFKLNVGGTPTTWTSPTAATCSTSACGITASTTDATVGNLGATTGGGGSGVVYVKSDVVM